jgi:hypothetical protein
LFEVTVSKGEDVEHHHEAEGVNEGSSGDFSEHLNIGAEVIRDEFQGAACRYVGVHGLGIRGEEEGVGRHLDITQLFLEIHAALDVGLLAESAALQLIICPKANVVEEGSMEGDDRVGLQGILLNLH